MHVLKNRNCLDSCSKAHHIDDIGIYFRWDQPFEHRRVLDELDQSGPLDVLPFKIRQWLRSKIEQNAALPQLLHVQVVAIVQGSI